jgi:competence protein ComEC
MATLFCLSILLQRKNHIVHTLGIAGFFWLCISPHSLFTPGFQLSFAATAGIAMLQPVLSGITGAVNSKISGNPVKFLVEKALSPLWVSVAAFAATAPTLLYHFGTLSLYGILFNLIAIPLMSGAMWLFFAAAALSPVAAAAKALIFCSEKILSLMIFMAGFCERIPASEIAVPYVHPALLAAMAAFMAGLCAVRVKLRGVYALRAGTATVTAIAVAALYATVTAKTEVFAPRGNGATAQVVIYKDNAAWVVLQGRRKEARNLRIRDIEPLLVRKTVRSLPLVVVDETLEDEAHELAFNTGFEPQITVLRDRGADFASGGDRRYGYTNIDGTGLAAADGSCRLTIGADGQVALTAK